MFPCTDQLQHLADSPAGRQGASCACIPALFTARLDSATLQDDTIRDDRVAPCCLGGSMVRRTLPEKLPTTVRKNFNVGGLENLSLPDEYRYYRSDFAILEVENEEGSNRLSLCLGCLPRYLVPGVAKLRNVASLVKYHLPCKRMRRPNYLLIVYVTQISRYVKWDSDSCTWKGPRSPAPKLLSFSPSINWNCTALGEPTDRKSELEDSRLERAS